MLTSIGKIKLYGLVRDATGRPKFDDIFDIPGPIWDMLTPAEQAEIEGQRAVSLDNRNDEFNETAH